MRLAIGNAAAGYSRPTDLALAFRLQLGRRVSVFPLYPAAMAEVSSKPPSLQAQINKQGGPPVVVDFWAPWCKPCTMFAPVLERVSARYKGQINVIKVNVDEHREIANRYNVKGIPTLLFFRDGQLCGRSVRTRTDRGLTSMFDQLVAGTMAGGDQLVDPPSGLSLH